MTAIQISLLGGFEARSGSGELLQLKGRKTQALLAYLALGSSRPRSRDELVSLLWGDRGEEQARSSLRQSLSELRKALGGADNCPLVTERDAVSLGAEAADVDVLEFERLIDDGRPKALERAIGLYRGTLLDGIGLHDRTFENWLRDERQRLNERAIEAFSRLLDHQAAGDTQQAVTTARPRSFAGGHSPLVDEAICRQGREGNGDQAVSSLSRRALQRAWAFAGARDRNPREGNP